jgi:hypothetical protein
MIKKILDHILIWNMLLSVSWEIELNEQCGRDIRKYEKKNPDELEAVLLNLEKYKEALDVAAHPRLVSFGFMHSEPKGMIAIDQTGGALPSGKKRKHLQETRLYTYSDLESKTLHLLCLGSKSSQSKDIRYAESAVDALRKG